MRYRYTAVVDGERITVEADRVVPDGYTLCFFLDGSLVLTLRGDDEIDSLELQN